ncbi:psychosine receptor [Rhinatrema bivittatum]|uniref:psychosine receptor n=1 Tax=Rhinatrema bivittatum TaxID=194408 RepID=UPI0011267175|nr:psychosine receptor [Rhinatrema bivittatum]
MNNLSNGCDVPHDQDSKVYPAIYALVMVISIPANCASLYVACLQVRKRNELGIYLFNLSLADLLYTLTLPLWIHYILEHNNWKLPKVLCSIGEFFKYTNFYTSAGFLTCICLDRYLAVVHPLHFHRLRTRKSAALISVAVWAAEILSHVIILVFEETQMDGTRHLLCYDIFPIEAWKAWLNVAQTCAWHVLPLAIMVFCYQRIYMAVRRSQAMAEREKRKVHRLLMGILAMFVLCFTPYHIMLLVRSVGEPNHCEFARRMSQPYKITMALASFNCIADPILYCFVSETGRTSILSCCAQRQMTPRQEVYEMSAIPKQTVSSDDATPV